MQSSARPARPQCKLWTRDLVLIILVNLCVFTNHIMSLSTFPFFIKSLGGTEALAGMCAAFFCLVAVIVRPFVGWWLDNGARRAVLVVGLILLAVALPLQLHHGNRRLRCHRTSPLCGGHGLLWHGHGACLGHRPRARP